MRIKKIITEVKMFLSFCQIIYFFQLIPRSNYGDKSGE